MLVDELMIGLPSWELNYVVRSRSCDRPHHAHSPRPFVCQLGSETATTPVAHVPRKLPGIVDRKHLQTGGEDEAGRTVPFPARAKDRDYYPRGHAHSGASFLSTLGY